MKRSLIVYVVVLVFMLNLTSASKESCTSEETMFTLFMENNSHVAVFNSSYSDSNYGVKLCYSDFFGTYTGSEDDPRTCSTDNVLLSVSGSTNAHIAEPGYYSQNICYGDLKCEIKDSCNIGQNERTIISMYSKENTHASYGDNSNYPWKLCCKKIAGGIVDGNESNNFNLSWINISITGLEDGKAYLTGVGINVSYTVGSIEDARNLSVEWSIAQDNFITLNDSFIKTFLSKGQKTIKFRAINYYGAKANFEIDVLAIPGESNINNGILAFISKPKYRELKKAIPENKNVSVEYSGEGSYVLTSNYNISNCNNGGQVTCLRGSCPENITNVPSGCNEIVIQGRGTNPNYNNLYFNWFESSLTSGSLKDVNTISGILKYPNTKFSLRPHDKKITLIVNYTNNVDGISISENINKSYTVGQCLANNAGARSRTYAWDIISGIEQITATVNPALYGVNGDDPNVFSGNSCKGPDGINQTDDDCCPLGLVCSGNNGCVIKNDYNPGCSARSGTNEETCKRTPTSEIKFPIDDGKCGYATVYCKWNESTKLCSDAGDYYNITDGSITVSKSISYQNLTSCDIASGYWKVNITSKCEGSCSLQGCNNSTIVTLSCGIPLFKVPVFGFWQFVLCMIFIVLAYILMSSRKMK